jgi:hypothetical protein
MNVGAGEMDIDYSKVNPLYTAKFLGLIPSLRRNHAISGASHIFPVAMLH